MRAEFQKLIEIEEREALAKFELIRESISLQRDKLLLEQNLNPDTDIRVRFYNLVYKALIFYNLNLLFHFEKLIDPKSINSIIPVPDYETSRIISNDYKTFNNNTLIYNLSSFVETYFRSILKSIKGEYFDGHFRTAKKKIFDISAIELNTDYSYALTVLFNVRNGIHNNGIYINNDVKYQHIRIKYRSSDYLFVHGFPIAGIDFNTLASVVEDIIGLAFRLNNSKTIKEIPVIEDIGVLKFR